MYVDVRERGGAGQKQVARLQCADLSRKYSPGFTTVLSSSPLIYLGRKQMPGINRCKHTGSTSLGVACKLLPHECVANMSL
jgi:hypothetical protein